jgi:poly-gamma-glutamate synthesis protein (capsule biosynthesis protein)
MRARPVAFAALALGAVAAAACAGTTQADVTLAGGPTTTAPSQRTTTTGSPQTTIPPPGSTGSGNPVTIAFGGDVNYDGTLLATLTSSPSTMLAGVKPVIDGADLTIVNLETAIGVGGDQATKDFTYQAPPAAFDALKANGVDVIAMANDHSLDYGQSGLTQTLAAEKAKSVHVIGIGENEAAAYRPFTARVNGQRIAIVDATQVIDADLIGSWTATANQGGVASALRVDRLIQEVADARRNADTVVVFLHWGTEGEYCPDADQETLARQLVDAGADVIVGTNAHRVQGGGYMGDSFVEYGLGNLQYKAGAIEAREGGMLSVTVTGRRIDQVVWHPISIGTDYLPTLMTGASANAAINRWNSRQACAKLAGAPATGPAPSPTTTTPVPTTTIKTRTTTTIKTRTSTTIRSRTVTTTTISTTRTTTK